MERYYKWRYKHDMYLVVKLYYDYQETTISFEECMMILTTTQNWTLDRAAKAWGYCVYCGFIQEYEELIEQKL